MLRIENVSKSFQKEIGVVKNITFEVPQGSFYTIVGESGCGKSTLLRCIAGLEILDSGVVLLNDKKVKGPDLKLVPGHDDIQVVFQDYELMPFHTVYENVRYKLIKYPEYYQKERSLAVLELCEILDIKDKKPRQLSGGQQQRIALARAIADEPDVILLDEPFSNLDNHLRSSFRELLKKINKEIKTTFIFVTHDAEDAMALGQLMFVMKNGEFIQKGTPEEVYKRPKSSYVAGFLGKPNMLKPSQFGFSSNETKMIWPENICLHTNDKSDFIGEIINKIFMGKYSEYEITYQDQVLTVYDNHSYELNQKVGFTINENHFWKIED